MAENKVQFNLKNVHYAVLTETNNGGNISYTWGTPVPVPGAVSLSLSGEGDTNKFYADGMAYYVSVANNGYSGDLEMARFPEQMLQDVWGFELDTTSKVLVEKNGVNAKPFALLFQVDGDQGDNRFLLYNCTATRPNVGGSTTEDTKTPATQSVTVTASPLADGRIKASTTAQTTEAVKSAWFTSVWEASK